MSIPDGWNVRVEASPGAAWCTVIFTVLFVAAQWLVVADFALAQRRGGGPRGGYSAARGSVATGPRGGVAVQGPRGGVAARGPYGGEAVRGPRGNAAARGPGGAAAARGPYGAAARGPNGNVVAAPRGWVAPPPPPVPVPVPVPVAPGYYGGYGYAPASGVAAGMALGAMLTVLPATAVAIAKSNKETVYVVENKCYREVIRDGRKVYEQIPCP
ncbi:hypothetical protein NNJEOMEG_01627 [Fundidesulfovibrio magnetotacticus]|uniref:Uncharacterized protein n=1 Tax=Fundidesulfovibrio magnetotacticus TaxID=2730080 RepID=A0A6V8LM88_9BACT|nr:hypothetical protein [Fundidesulfovibrio magnetotacticus]GFK93793.1 hypothetical protein NNJEOMEG_01627 [Fundidesulfovibrio magnetotacticus]